MGEQAPQKMKTPLCAGLLAHVSASRGEPHINPLRSFRFSGGLYFGFQKFRFLLSGGQQHHRR